MNFRIFIHIGMLVTLLAGQLACDTFDPGEVRNNPSDPESEQFTPHQPSDISVSHNGNRIALQWKDNSEFEDGYIIKHAIDDSSHAAFKEIAQLEPNTTKFEYELDQTGLMLFIRVEAVTEDQNQLPDSLLQKNASIRLADISDLRVRFPVENKVTISWQAPLSVETGYKIMFKAEDHPYSEVGEVENNGSANRTFQFEHDLQNSVDYHAKIVLLKNAFAVESSSWYSNTFYKPLPPAGLTLSPVSESSLELRWEILDNTLPDPGQFIIKRKSGSESTFQETGRVAGDVTRFVDEGLSREHTYIYQVRSLTSSPASIKANYSNNVQFTDTLFDVGSIADFDIHPTKDQLAFGYSLSWYTGNNEKVFAIGSSGNIAHEINLGQPHIQSVGYSPDGSEIIVTNFEAARIFNSATGEQLFKLAEEGNTYYDADYSADGSYLAIAGQDLTLWNTSDRSLQHQYTRFDLIKGVAFNPTNNRELAFVTHYDNKLTVINTQDASVKHTLVAPDDIHSFSYNRDGSLVATFSVNKFILWDLATGNKQREWTLEKTSYPMIYPPNPSEGIQFLKNGKIVVGAYLLDPETDYITPLNLRKNEATTYPIEVIFEEDSPRVFVAYDTIEQWEYIEGWFAVDE